MDENRIALARYRHSRAVEELETARSLFNNKLFSSAISSSYYSILHSTRALLAMEKIDSKSHRGVLHLLNIHHIKTKKIDSKLFEIMTEAHEMRMDSDYQDFYIATKQEALEQVENAEYFLTQIKIYIRKIYNVEL